MHINGKKAEKTKYALWLTIRHNVV